MEPEESQIGNNETYKTLKWRRKIRNTAQFKKDVKDVMEEWEQKNAKNRENRTEYCSNLTREFTQALNTVAMKNIGQNSRKKRGRKKINWSPELYELTRAEKEAYDRWKRTNEEERTEAFREYKVLSRIKR